MKYEKEKIKKLPVNGKKSGSVCYGIGDNRIGGGNCLFKYMTIKSALTCLEDGNIMFQEPSQWKDQFESRFYCADYSSLPFFAQHPEWVNKLFACCFTTNPQCEAAWKMYGSDFGRDDERFCVRLKINRNALRNCLNHYALTNDMRVYEGKVNYGMTNYTIEHLHELQLVKRNGEQVNNADYKKYFHNFQFADYLRLLLIKRKAFKYEDEFRTFLVPNENMLQKKNSPEGRIFPAIDWHQVIDEILVDNNTPDYLFENIVHRCGKYGIPSDKIKLFNIYGATGSNIKIDH